MRYFPLFIDLKDRRAVVIGSGEEALRKVRLLLKTEVAIDIIAPELSGELADLRDAGRVIWKAKHFVPRHLDDAAVVYVADKALEEIVAAEALKRKLPVNVVDRAELSSFIQPSIVDRDPVVVAIGTEGAAPVLGQGLRARIDAMLPSALGRLASTAESLRERIAGTVAPGFARRDFWQKYFFGSIRDSFMAGDNPAYARELEAALAGNSSPPAGRVSLVGAGPGDPELLTLKAQRKLIEADVIVYDRLVGPAILEMARRDALRIPVGKTPYEPSPKQGEINRILINEAKAGRRVVRLKGGDPYIFGRGGEEQAALEAAGIAVDVVPGITAALGCAASIGLPLTQRGQNTSITLLTGTSERGLAEQNWTALAQPGQAVAIYMGVNMAGDIAAKLLDGGIDPACPVTLVENGTLETERTFVTTIGDLWEAVASKGIYGPAVIYVGLAKAKASADIVAFPVRASSEPEALRAAS
ncbi:MAG: uroporphyrinogen-III C-methyltransferase [Rhizobiales bacterium]|nr:uroporphyrinogen-III C-methyltransferase [Hyphomicrobiales bacterium]